MRKTLEDYPNLVKKFGFLEIRRIEVDINVYNQKAYDVFFFNKNI